jgi:uncharacterized membrane protein
MIPVLVVAALVSSGLVAGVLFIGLVAVQPALRSVTPGTYVTVKQAFDRTYPPFMRPLQLTALAVSLALTVTAGVQGKATCAVLAGLAFLSIAVNIVVTVRGDLPINVAMASWRADDPPSDWEHHQARWDTFNKIRTVAAVTALVLLAVASVAPR